MMPGVRVALTFDAEHPDRPGADERGLGVILDVLAANSVRSTFFVQGRWAEAHPQAARSIAEGGHLIGSHSHFHARMPLLTEEGLRADVVQAGRAIREATGVDPRPWFRCPWGHGTRDPRVVMALRRQRYVAVGWDVVADDWEPSRGEDDLVRDVTVGVQAIGDGAIVLLHTWPSRTGAGLPAIVRGLREAGSRFVTVEDLADRDLTTTPDPGTVAENPR
jgi:peptidoglycan/xylan/chitin deacetylase (PgdA/CDA1 family)